MTIKTTTKALLGTAVSFALLSTASTAYAADLDNLSDDELLARIERLEKLLDGKGNPVLNGNKKIKLKLSGQVNQKARFASDGTESQFNVVDNDSSSTRVRLDGKAKLNDRFSVKTKWEVDFEVNPSDEVTIRGDSSVFGGDDIAPGFGSGDSAQIDLRRAEVVFVDKLLGSLTIGQSNTASNNSVTRDISGTGLAVGVAGSFDDDDINFSAVSGLLLDGGGSDDEIGDFIDPNDGNSRAPVIRYDTPRFAGFSIGTSVSEERFYDVALDYQTKDLAGFSIVAGGAYSVAPSDGVEDTLQLASGSASILHNDTGLSLTGYVGGDIQDGDRSAAIVAAGATEEYFFWGIKGGIKRNIISLGSTAFGVDVGFGDSVADASEIEDISSFTVQQQVDAINNTESRTVAVQVTQKIDKLSAELYAGWRQYDIDLNNGIATDSINVFAAGSRVKF